MQRAVDRALVTILLAHIAYHRGVVDHPRGAGDVTGTVKPTLNELQKLVEQALAEARRARDELSLANFKFAHAKVEFQHVEAARDLAKHKYGVAEAKVVAARLDYFAATLEHAQNPKAPRR
jgi:hypothetical protein